MEVVAGATGLIKLWDRLKDDYIPIEPGAFDQLFKARSLPFIHKHIAVMPDAHQGIGCTVGSVIPTIGAVIPACVGVDIGCGMMALQTSLKAEDLPESLGTIRSSIEKAVPHGNGPGGSFEGSTGFSRAALSVNEPFCSDMLRYVKPFVGDTKKAHLQMGTLGGGNHFIELSLDENDHLWIVLHSGSRGIGNKIGTYFIELAREDMRKHFINLPDKDLAYLVEGTEHFDAYVKAVGWAQDYARKNRQAMMAAIVFALGPHFQGLGRGIITGNSEPAVQCHHNYIEKEHHFGADPWVARKGAIRAREGDMGIIPGAMGRSTFIVRGKGNPESFNSASHGAGRLMSRTEARRRFTVEDHIRETAGLECRKDEGVVDETPMAYKNVQDVMAAQEDLVEIVHTLRAVVTVKG